MLTLCRANGIIKGSVSLDADDIVEERNMSFFFATQNSIMMKLRECVITIPGHDEVIANIINDCASLYESGNYVLPSEKHTLLKVMAFGLYLADGAPGSKISIYKSKYITISRFDKIFSVCVRDEW